MCPVERNPDIEVFDFLLGFPQNVFGERVVSRVLIFAFEPLKNRVPDESDTRRIPQRFRFLYLPCKLSERPKTFSDQAYLGIELLEDSPGTSRDSGTTLVRS